MNSTSRTGVLFICMGNICRSPIAEGVFLDRINRHGVADRFHVDSAGTGGWHTGHRADPRALAVAKANRITLPSRARQVDRCDFTRFDHLVCMDEQNRSWLLDRGAPAERVALLLEYDPSAPVRDVPDPYEGSADDFDRVFRLIDAACSALLDDLLGPGGS